MKVKTGKKSDIIDALKHLKITDRRSRPLLKGRTINTLASFGESQSDASKLLRLSRSTSLTSPICGYDIGCCRACEFCHMIGTTGFRNRLSDNQRLITGVATLETTSQDETINTSPFTKSAGLLYTTLPTKWSRRNPDLNLPDNHRLTCNRSAGSSYLRRSFGTDLSYFGEDNCTSKIESSSSVSTTTLPIDRLSCCCRHDMNITLPVHLRLYRWLYSLVDHPCVSLYYSCRYHTSTHATLSRGSSIISTSHRHSLNLRHHHTIALASGHTSGGLYSSNARFPLSSYSKSPDTASECETNISSKNASTFSELNDHVMPCGLRANVPGAFPSELRSSNVLGNNTNFRPGGQNKFGGRNPANSSFHAEDEQSYGGQRCRRNSDPEQWQQMRTSESSDEHFTSFCSGDTGASDNQNQNSAYHSAGVHVCTKSNEKTLTLNNLSDSSGFTVSKTVSRVSPFETSFRSNLPSQPSPFTTTNSISKKLFDRPNTTDSELNGPIPGQFSFTFARPSSNSSSTDTQQRFSNTNSNNQFRSLFRPSVVPTNLQMDLTTKTQLFPNCSYPNYNPSGDGVTDDLPEQFDTKSSGFSCSSKSLPISYPDLTKLTLSNTVPREDSTQNYSSVHLNSASDQDSTICGVDSLPHSNRSQLTSDISVNELASYMEHMVHIPGRMSEMAQRMYL